MTTPPGNSSVLHPPGEKWGERRRKEKAKKENKGDGSSALLLAFLRIRREERRKRLERGEEERAVKSYEKGRGAKGRGRRGRGGPDCGWAYPFPKEEGQKSKGEVGIRAPLSSTRMERPHGKRKEEESSPSCYGR